MGSLLRDAELELTQLEHWPRSLESPSFGSEAVVGEATVLIREDPTKARLGKGLVQGKSQRLPEFPSLEWESWSCGKFEHRDATACEPEMSYTQALSPV